MDPRPDMSLLGFKPSLPNDFSQQPADPVVGVLTGEVLMPEQAGRGLRGRPRLAARIKVVAQRRHHTRC